jgi:hypothetical protein
MRLLLEEVSREHFPYSPATPEQVEEFERWVGWSIVSGRPGADGYLREEERR